MPDEKQKPDTNDESKSKPDHKLPQQSPRDKRFARGGVEKAK